MSCDIGPFDDIKIGTWPKPQTPQARDAEAAYQEINRLCLENANLLSHIDALQAEVSRLSARVVARNGTIIELQRQLEDRDKQAALQAGTKPDWADLIDKGVTAGDAIAANIERERLATIERQERQFWHATEQDARNDVVPAGE